MGEEKTMLQALERETNCWVAETEGTQVELKKVGTTSDSCGSHTEFNQGTQVINGHSPCE